MKDIRFFKWELEHIYDETLRNIIAGYLLEAVPDRFWTDPASSTGKYHPKFTRGEGGLVRHTKATIRIARELLELAEFETTSAEKDFIYAALLTHDTQKYGLDTDVYDPKAYKDHSINAAVALQNYALTKHGYDCPEMLLDAIRGHMGQFQHPECVVDNPVSNCVRMADYTSSLHFFDMPVVSEEYDFVKAIIEYEATHESVQDEKIVFKCAVEGDMSEYPAMKTVINKLNKNDDVTLTVVCDEGGSVFVKYKTKSSSKKAGIIQSLMFSTGEIPYLIRRGLVDIKATQVVNDIYYVELYVPQKEFFAIDSEHSDFLKRYA